MNRPLVVSALAFAAVLAASAPADARPTIVFTQVDVPKEGDAARLGHDLRGFLTEAARKANFGKGSKKQRLELTARVVEFALEERGDVVEVHCTIAGRVVGGRGARSHLSFGGSPANRAALEKQVLKMVANGLVSRLADITRAENP